MSSDLAVVVTEVVTEYIGELGQVLTSFSTPSVPAGKTSASPKKGKMVKKSPDDIAGGLVSFYVTSLINLLICFFLLLATRLLILFKEYYFKYLPLDFFFLLSAQY